IQRWLLGTLHPYIRVVADIAAFVATEDKIGVMVPESTDIGCLERLAECPRRDLFPEATQVLGKLVEDGGVTGDLRCGILIHHPNLRKRKGPALNFHRLTSLTGYN